jgi:hypothetical protein
MTHPERISAEEFRQYVPGNLISVGGGHAWKDLLGVEPFEVMHGFIGLPIFSKRSRTCWVWKPMLLSKVWTTPGPTN